MLKKNITFSLLLVLLFLSSCNYTRHLPEGKQLLWENKVVLEDGGSASGQAKNILKQQPNRSILGLRPSLALYNWGDGTDSSFFGRLGQAPVLLDSTKVNRGLEQLQNYYFNKGYFEVSGRYQIVGKKEKRRGRVQYILKRGPRYSIDTIVYEIATGGLRSIENQHRRNSKLKAGQYYDSEKLEEERSRLRELFRQNGYYNFSSNFISFQVDTISPDKKNHLQLELIIKDQTKRQGDSVVSLPHKPSQISEVLIKPDYSFIVESDSKDTLSYQKYQLVYDSLQYKPRYLADAIHFEPGDRYNQEKVKGSYSHLASYNAFDVTEITFRELANDSNDTPRLQGIVRLAPRDKLTFSLNAEVTNTSNNYGLSGGVGIINRNLFRAGEALRLDISSGLEYQPTLGNVNNLSRTFELGAELAIDFPRFLVPFNSVGLVPKRMQPESSLSLFANRTNRIEFNRETFGGRLVYRWKESSLKRHNVNLINLSYSDIVSIQNNFVEQLNPIQALAFNSEFISSTSWGFNYSGPSNEYQRNYHFFKSDVEIGGTLLSLASQERPSDGFSTLLEVPVYQFMQVETDYRHYWRITDQQQWVQRLLLGYVMPFGVSRINSPQGDLRLPPFSRFFFLGGTNDLRAWPAFRAGGGTDRVTSYSGSSRDSSGFAIGTVKALMSSEYRFPLIAGLKGAVFIDAGNIWLTGGLENDQPQTGIDLDQIWNQMYIGSGLGLRLDLDFFVIRFDTGLKLRDPGYLDQNNGWVISSQPVLPNLTYNIALGYPF